MRSVAVFLLVGGFAVGCGESGADDGRRPYTAPPQAGSVLFADALDDDRNGWGVDRSELHAARFEGGANVRELRGVPLSFSFPDKVVDLVEGSEVDMSDVVVQATIQMEHAGEVAGVFCRSGPSADADLRSYEFMVRDGFAAIRISDNNERIQVLAKTDRIELPSGEPVAVRAACVDSPGGGVGLWLVVNGDPILYALAKERLSEGLVGIGVYPAPGAHKDNPTVVRFLDFSVSRPA